MHGSVGGGGMGTLHFVGLEENFILPRLVFLYCLCVCPIVDDPHTTERVQATCMKCVRQKYKEGSMPDSKICE